MCSLKSMVQVVLDKPYSGYISRGESFEIRPFCLFRGKIIRGLDFEKKNKKIGQLASQLAMCARALVILHTQRKVKS